MPFRIATGNASILDSSKNDMSELLYQLMRTHKYYAQVSILNASGYEVVKVNNLQSGSIEITTDKALRDERQSDTFQMTVKLDKNQLYSSPLATDTRDQNAIPIIALAMPLVDSQGGKLGVISILIDFSVLIRQLPENTLIQTLDGNLLFLDTDGKINFSKSTYTFDQASDLLVVSISQTLHYDFVEFLQGKTLIVAVDHKHPSLETDLHRLVLISALLFLLFLFLVLIIAAMTISKSRKLVDAEKAVISSLAGLAEWRDPETGAHLKMLDCMRLPCANNCVKTTFTGMLSRTNSLRIYMMLHHCMTLEKWAYRTLFY